jgi:hypothetical protein
MLKATDGGLQLPPGLEAHSCEKAEQDAGPNEKERQQAHVQIGASLARSLSSVSFKLGRNFSPRHALSLVT